MHFDDAPAPLHHSETRWSSGVLGEMLHCAERKIALEKNKWGKYYKEMISFLIPLLEDSVAATFISVQNFYY